MSSTNQPIERLSLTFRAEAPPATRSVLPGGWWIWCLLGMGIGLGGWLLARHSLAKQLGSQLAQAKTRSEALMAMESLMLLDPTASGEIVAGLKNTDVIIARTAFRTLESQITRWQELSDQELKSRIQLLSQALAGLPNTIPEENAILASSLASRLIAACIDRHDIQLEPAMAFCQQVIQRSGRSQRAAEFAKPTAASLPLASTAEFTEPMVGQLPPPPLPPQYADSSNVFSLNDSTTEDSYTEESNTEESYTAAIEHDVADAQTSPPSELPAQNTMRMSVSAEPALRSAGGGRATLKLVQAPVRSIYSNAHSSATNDDPSTTEAAETLQGNSDTSPSLEAEARELAGIDSVPIGEVVRMLGSVQPQVTKAAALSLRRRGMPDSQIALAIELATGTEQQRLEILDQLHRRTDLPDPRVWLLWMAQDGQPSVRQRSVAMLHSMLDVDVLRELRLLLQREQDSQVAQTIRQVLTNPR